MKLLITGSSGFLGSFVADRTMSGGHEVLGVDMVEPRWNPNLKHEICSIEDKDAVRGVFAQFRPDCVIHLAGLLGTQETFVEPTAVVTSNVIGAVTVLECCRDFDASYIGVQTGTPWLSPYAITKKCATDFAKAFHEAYALPVSVLKVYNAYGPRQDGVNKVNKIIPRFIYGALTDSKMPIFGDGRQVVDLVYAGDCAAAFGNAVTRARFDGEVIEVGCGAPTRVVDAANLVRDRIGGGTLVFEPRRLGEGLEYPLADTTSLTQVLGVQPSAPLAWLDSTIEWYEHYFKQTNVI